MPSVPKRSPPRPARPLIELALGAAWLVGSAAVLLVLDAVLGAASMATALIGAMLLDLASSRAGVAWDVAGAVGEAWGYALPDRTPRRAVQRVAIGAGVALVVGGAVLGLSAGLRWLGGHGEGIHPSFALGFALVRAAAVAVRDELLYRGIPLFAAARAGVSARVSRVFSALLSGAAIALMPGVTLGAVALAVGGGWLFASLWQRDRGAWAAIGAHAMWALLIGSVVHGGLFDLDWNVGNLAMGPSAEGAPAWLAAAALVGAGFAVRAIPERFFGPGARLETEEEPDSEPS
jgi:hypothetical protein